MLSGGGGEGNRGLCWEFLWTDCTILSGHFGCYSATTRDPVELILSEPVHPIKEGHYVDWYLKIYDALGL